MTVPGVRKIDTTLWKAYVKRCIDTTNKTLKQFSSMKLIACCLICIAGLVSCAVMRNITIPSQYDDHGKNTISFFCLGDWGKSSTYSSRRLNGDDDTTSTIRANGNNNQKDQYYQKEIAAAMDTYSSKSIVKPKFLESLGDNFYKNGVSSTTDSMWTYLYTNVYRIYSSLQQIPFYPVFGNHDYGNYEAGLQAQIQRSNIDQYWYMPAKNYSLTFTLDDDSVKITIIHIDTTTLAPEQNKLTNQNGGISYDVQQSRIENQMGHIKNMLDSANNSRPDYLLVSGHYPVVSKGEHGDISSLVTLLHPLFKEYQVDMYIAGHDHIGSHLIYENVHYDLFGAGSMTSTLGNYNSYAQLQWAGVGYSSFGVIEANKDELTASWYDINNEKKYSHTLSNQHLRQKYEHKPETPGEPKDPIIPPHKPPKSEDDDNKQDGAINKIPSSNNKPHGVFTAAASVSMIVIIAMAYSYLTNKNRKYKTGLSKSALSFFPKRSPRTKSHQVLKSKGELYKKQSNYSNYSDSLAMSQDDTNEISHNTASCSYNEDSSLNYWQAPNDNSYEDLQNDFHENDTISDITSYHHYDTCDFASTDTSSLSHFNVAPSGYNNAYTLHTLIQSERESFNNRLSNLPTHNRSISDNIIYKASKINRKFQQQYQGSTEEVPINHSIDILPRFNMSKHRRNATSFI